MISVVLHLNGPLGLQEPQPGSLQHLARLKDGSAILQQVDRLNFGIPARRFEHC